MKIWFMWTTILVNNDVNKRKRHFSVFYVWSASKNLNRLLATTRHRKEMKLGMAEIEIRGHHHHFCLNLYAKTICQNQSASSSVKLGRIISQVPHPGTPSPGCSVGSPYASLILPTDQDPSSAPWGHQSVPQWCHNSTCLQPYLPDPRRSPWATCLLGGHLRHTLQPCLWSLWPHLR